MYVRYHTATAAANRAHYTISPTIIISRGRIYNKKASMQAIVFLILVYCNVIKVFFQYSLQSMLSGYQQL